MAQELHSAVRAVVNAADPVGLLAIGAPDDEYEPEIQGFIARMDAGERPDEDMVRSVLTYWLRTGVRVTDESIATIAEALSALPQAT